MTENGAVISVRLYSFSLIYGCPVFLDPLMGVLYSWLNPMGDIASTGCIDGIGEGVVEFQDNIRCTPPASASRSTLAFPFIQTATPTPRLTSAFSAPANDETAPTEGQVVTHGDQAPSHDEALEFFQVFHSSGLKAVAGHAAMLLPVLLPALLSL